jgi:hypothetical protein
MTLYKQKPRPGRPRLSCNIEGFGVQTGLYQTFKVFGSLI